MKGVGEVQLHPTAYGAAAYDVLREVIERVKRDDPLAPVTLIVPSNLAGTVARRTLATTTTAHGVGIAGLAVLTVDRLADLLAAPPGSGRDQYITAGCSQRLGAG